MSGDSIDNMIENFVGSVRQNTEALSSNEGLSGFTLKEEKKTNEGAAQYLIAQFAKGWKHHFPKKRAEPKWTKWGDIVRDGYFGWQRLSKKRFEEIIALAGGEVVDNKLVIPEDENLEEEEVVEEKETVWDEEPSEETEALSSWEYDPEEETEPTWAGFSAEELEVIEILNAAYLRGHTPQSGWRAASFYSVHFEALCTNSPMPVRARKNAEGGGYCADADGKYTGGLMNCAVTSAKWGMGIMVPEEKERVQKQCMRACPNCPNKKWQHNGAKNEK